MAKKKRRTDRQAPKARAEVPKRASVPAVSWSMGNRLALGIVAVLCLTGLLSRVVAPWDFVFPATGEIRLLGVDPYFHLRHAQVVADDFPNLQRWDVGTHFPIGHRSDAVSLFDFAIGSAAYLLGLGNPSERLVTWVAAWTPAILGALSIGLVYLVAQTVLPRIPALTASAVFVLYPGSSLHRSLLGFADHHIAEIVLGLLITWGMTRSLQRCEGNKLTTRQLLSTVTYVLPLVAVLFTWVGGPIYLVLVLCLFVVMTSVEVGHGAESMTAARASFLYGSTAFIIISLVGTVVPDIVMVVSLFPLVQQGCVAIALLPGAFALTGRYLVRQFGSPRTVTLGLLLLVIAAATMYVWRVPDASYGASLVLHQKASGLAEHRAVDLNVYWKLLGPAGLLGVLALPLAALRVRTFENRHAVVPILTAVFWSAMWIYTNDYDYVPPAYISLLAAFTIEAILKHLSKIKTAWGRHCAITGICAGVLVPIWPLGDVVEPWATSRLAATHTVIHEGWEQAMHWLRNETPQPSIAVGALIEHPGDYGFHYPPDTYGVMVPWDYGNMVNSLGRRVPVWSRWPNRHNAAWFLGTNEDKSRQLLCPKCEEGEHVRYVVMEARTIADHFPTKVVLAGRKMHDYDTRLESWFSIGNGKKVPHRTYGRLYHRSMAVRLYLDDARNLGHYRLVYESAHQSYIPYLLEFDSLFRRIAYKIHSDSEREAFAKRTSIGQIARAPTHYEYDGVITGTVKIFEHVNGARLQGTTTANTSVEARLQLRCGPEGRVVDYSRSVRTGDDGRFELVAAHATAPGMGTWCTPEGAYEISIIPAQSGEAVESIRVLVEDSQILNGEIIDLGRLN